MRLDESKTFDMFLLFSSEVQKEADPYSPPFQLIRNVDSYLRKHIFNVDLDVPPSAAFLSVNAIWLLYGAARNTLQGQPSLIYPILRTALENACYVIELCANPSLEDIWRDRHDSNSKKNKSRRHFQNAVVNAKRKLNAAQEDFGEWMYEMYESFIDFGAHPNPKAIFTHLSQDTETEETEDGYYRFSFQGLYSFDSFESKKSQLATAETAVVIVIILTIALKGLHEAELEEIIKLNSEKNQLAAAMGLKVLDQLPSNV